MIAEVIFVVITAIQFAWVTIKHFILYTTDICFRARVNSDKEALLIFT